MDFAEAIRHRRLELGLDLATVARQCGLSVYEYGDLEQHADEFETAISTRAARIVCHALGLNFRTFIGLPSDPAEQAEPAALVRIARQREGMSQDQLADRIGFDVSTVRDLENGNSLPDALPLSVLYDLEAALRIERGVLVREDSHDVSAR